MKITHPYHFDTHTGRVRCNGCGREAKYILHAKDRYPIPAKSFIHREGCQVAEQEKEQK